jgi:DNA-binding NarL/FixJ family response regulator
MGIRILLADDHTIVLQGLSRFLREQEDMEVVGQAKDGLATVELARELAPDIIIMDISMPGLSGVEATRQIHNEKPDIKIIGLSMHAPGYAEMYKAMPAVLLKDCDLMS